MKVLIDKKKCIGCMLCTELVEGVFEMDDDKSRVKEDAKINEASIRSQVRIAAKSCPTGAIKIIA